MIPISWKTVSLGEILEERKEKPSSQALATGAINIVSKIAFNDGKIQLRQDSETKTGMIIIRPGDLVISGINAAKGAIAIYDEKETKPIAATIHYGAYTPNKKLVDIRYLWWLLRSNTFRDLLNQYVPGGIKTELKSKRLLPIPIPLPSLLQQRRTVDRIEYLASKTEEARILNDLANEEMEKLCRAIISSDKEIKPTAMNELVRLRQPDVLVQRQETYQFAGVYCFGRGVFRGGTKTGIEFAYPRLTRLQTGNFVYPKLMAWEGAFGVVPKECNGYVVSTEFPVFEVDERRIFPEVLDTYFKSPTIWSDIAGASTGTNVRRRRLNPQDFLAYKFPLPSRATQEKLRKIKIQIDTVRPVLDKIVVELKAILPSILDKAFKGELL